MAARNLNIITARSAILIDNHSGELLWERNPDMELPPASTTKVMTAMLALQSGQLEESFAVSDEAAAMPASKISLRPGWEMRLRDLVYAILLNSANDASVVIAEGLSGSVPAFAERMTATAHAIGARKTHFVNPNGLPADDHYSTARDLTTIFAHAMREPQFEEIIGTQRTLVVPASGTVRPIALHSHNRLLGNYKIRVIGKTGWTRAAKKCFVGAAEADGRQILVGVLGSTNLWGDVRRLVEYGFYGGPSPASHETIEAVVVAREPAAGIVGGDEAVPVKAHGKFRVRSAVFRDMATASGVKRSVVRHGYPARIETARVGKRKAYRVSLGTFRSRIAAQQAAVELKKSNPAMAPTVVSAN